MKKQCILRIATGLIGLLLLLTAGGYILRNVLLNHVVEQRLASVGKRHELDIRYRHLTLKSINTSAYGNFSKAMYKYATFS